MMSPDFRDKSLVENVRIAFSFIYIKYSIHGFDAISEGRTLRKGEGQEGKAGLSRTSQPRKDQAGRASRGLARLADP
ncbi:hypothetical protein [Gluconobacter albidus]|uniref:hypothetical protein n=1 Tax=Gluconobacter albidus TaxID=318683 RepID=UPI001B8CE15F|nr:hypothetical protein [Gluconobacter albidus]MBS1029604.1 hypothetical protein [Gluconobacter albidus]